MKKPIAVLLSLFTFIVCANTDQQDFQETANKTEKNTFAQDNVKNDMKVLFGEKTEIRKESEQAFAVWGVKLNEFLMSSGDQFTQAMTLAKMVSSLDTARLVANINNEEHQVDVLDDLSYQPFADVLNQLIALPKISADTFDVLSKVCFHKQMADFCHANVLLEKRMQQDTSNLQAYLRPFDMAAQTKNTQTMQQLIQLMAVSEHSQTVLNITATMSSLIDEFIDDNPVPQSAIDNMISDYEKLTGVSPSMKKKLNTLMPDYMPSHIKSAYKYLNDLPPYKPVLEYCQKHIMELPQCRKIAQTLITKSNSMIDKAMGHSILIATYELEREQNGIEAAALMNKQFRASYECIRDLSKDSYFIDSYFNPEYQKIHQTATDEFEMMIDLAEFRYQNLKAQGDESAVNPDSCFKKSSTDDE